MGEKTGEKLTVQAGAHCPTGLDRGRMTRRKFVSYSIFGFLGICLAGTVRFFSRGSCSNLRPGCVWDILPITPSA